MADELLTPVTTVTAEIVAHAIIDLPQGGTWRAFAVRDELVGEWRLYIEQAVTAGQNTTPVLAGTYKQAKALTKVVRHRMKEKFPLYHARVDTFDALIRRSDGNVVPRCLGQFEEVYQFTPAKCVACVFRGECGSPGHPETVEIEEPAEVLQKRLREKMAAKYGDTP